ncbi:hypothetical protein LP090_10200 [Moraxella bovis]|uniref:hypothetical protein n=1 Tax=Moraxella bovis TaxID=476 RepID=UPI002225DE1B|nr:hypothetical protein [Moraxella bovis]UZA42554.1 hypothetical protein LP090_10200 [Moraxella bovis]
MININALLFSFFNPITYSTLITRLVYQPLLWSYSMNKSNRVSIKNSTSILFKQDIECFIHKFQKHDAVIITALHDDFYKYKQPILNNNRALYSALFALGYPITELDSSYIKDYQKLLKLNNDFFMGSYLVVNRFNKPDFIETMAKLANYYGQEFIFIIQGGENSKEYLLGTKEKGRLKLGQRLFYPECHFLMNNPKFFKPYRNRKFYFTGAMKDSKILNSQIQGVYQPANWLGRWACSTMDKRVLRKIGILCS